MKDTTHQTTGTRTEEDATRMRMYLGLSLSFSFGLLGADPVGLSLNFRNGSMAPIPIVSNAPRYLQEVDIVVTMPPSTTDQGIQPLISGGEMSSLNWSGVKMVEEDWRPMAGAPGFQRQRFYRGAAWMKRSGYFRAQPLDVNGRPSGAAMTVLTGADEDDDDARGDAFVRRFVARQIATGCPAVNNCTGATFVAEGLVQWRDALNPASRTVTLSPSTKSIQLAWSEDPAANRTVAVSFPSPGTYAWGYGFTPQLAPVNPPANGLYYVPGEQVSLRITFRDGGGNRLHPAGSLPTFADAAFGVDQSGIRYFNVFGLNPTLYYAQKHREANMIVQLSGPTQKLKTPVGSVGLGSIFLPQVPTATTATDGWTGLTIFVPPAAVTFTGAWSTPVSDVVTFTLPADTLPGTYTASIKARREFGGEALNRTGTIDLMVGSATPTAFAPKTGNCSNCHNQDSQLSKLLHGNGDRRTCFTCHSGIDFEPDSYLDVRVHMVHDRSKRFEGDVRKCSTCHLSEPAGPARGLLPK